MNNAYSRTNSRVYATVVFKYYFYITRLIDYYYAYKYEIIYHTYFPDLTQNLKNETSFYWKLKNFDTNWNRENSQRHMYKMPNNGRESIIPKYNNILYIW
jgi:hypothetical protein